MKVSASSLPSQILVSIIIITRRAGRVQKDASGFFISTHNKERKATYGAHHSVLSRGFVR